jgi:phosphoenolpyruvate synthase/pyruvate phosphate dikinase
MNEFKIITIENNESFVTIETLVKFSGNAEKHVKKLIREYEEDISEFDDAFSKRPLKDNLKYFTRNVGNEISWKLVELNEDQASYVLTLMVNSPEVE